MRSLSDSTGAAAGKYLWMAMLAAIVTLLPPAECFTGIRYGRNNQHCADGLTAMVQPKAKRRKRHPLPLGLARAVLATAFGVLLLALADGNTYYGYTDETHELCMTPCQQQCRTKWNGESFTCHLNFTLKVDNYGYAFKSTPCDGPCRTWGNVYNWCVTEENWDYCHPRANFASKLNKPCMSECQRESETSDVAFCYTNDMEKSECLYEQAMPGSGHIFPWWGHNSTHFLNAYRVPRATRNATVRNRRQSILGNSSTVILEQAVYDGYRVNVENPIFEVTEPPFDSPINHIMELRINSQGQGVGPPNSLDTYRIPILMTATIRQRHLIRRSNMPARLDYHMRRMNAGPKDQRGHLLAASLGGPNIEFNIVPQSPSLNQHQKGVINSWRDLEDLYRNFLSLNTTNERYVRWGLEVNYNTTRTRNTLTVVSTRPTGFTLNAECWEGSEIDEECSVIRNAYFTNA